VSPWYTSTDCSYFVSRRFSNRTNPLPGPIKYPGGVKKLTAPMAKVKRAAFGSKRKIGKMTKRKKKHQNRQGLGGGDIPANIDTKKHRRRGNKSEISRGIKRGRWVWRRG